tara:strand:+ start:2804 stop:3322 length:519 start_codon:yes stop_codon:yes gene_type:complete
MIIRLMGEIDIHSFRTGSLLVEQPVMSNLQTPDGVSDSDMVNWLGWALDSGAADRLKEDEEFRGQVETAGRYLTGQLQPDLKNDQFIMLLILRERWPVGSKAKFKVIADRVGASHTYNLMVCPVQEAVDFDDNEAMSSVEAKSLNAMVPVMKRSRKQFANSSGLQQFLKNLS